MHGGFRIEPGSAAKDAERRNREAGPVGTTPVGIRVSRAVGQKFEFEAGPVQHAGEAQPRVVVTPVERPAQQPAEQPPVAPPAPSAVAQVWNKFRSWFGSK